MAIIIASCLGWLLGLVGNEALHENVEVMGEQGSLVAFVATLAITPIITVTGWRVLWLRKWFGLLTFAYGMVDGIRFAITDGLPNMLSEPFLIVGTITLILLMPLALTSTRAAMRRLGRRWKQLHTLTYVAVASLLLHIALIPGESGEVVLPALLFAPLLVLRVPRVRDWFVRRRYNKIRSL